MFSYMSKGKKGWNCWSLLNIFWRDKNKKTIINKITQTRDRPTNATQDQIEFEGWK